MNFIRILVFGAVTASTILAGAATYGKWGVPTVAHPQGLMLRQESVAGQRTRAGFVPMGLRRMHRGGGISGGK